MGFGWAKPVPYNPYFLHKNIDELKVAIAGITANVALAALLAIPLRIANLNHQIIDDHFYLQVLDAMVNINLMLAAFNIIPIPPLDGSHFIEYFLSLEQRLKFMHYGQYVLMAVIFYGIFSGNSIIFRIMEPIFRILSLALKGTYSLNF